MMLAKSRLLLVACAGAILPATTSVAEPTGTRHVASTNEPAGAKHVASTNAPRPAATLRNVRNVAAYMAGKQALVGLHAASDKTVARDEQGKPLLSLMTVNRHESLEIPVGAEGAVFSAMDLDRVAHLLRSYAGEEHPVDPRTLSLVYQIQTHFDVPEVRVVSGYRVPRPGSRSNHGKGRAIDLIVPGVPDEEVARFAREVGFTGVGVYPTSQFVHVDIRPRSYFWIDTSGPHMKNHERGILAELAAKSDANAISRGQAPVEPFAVMTNFESVPPPSAPLEEGDDDDAL